MRSGPIGALTVGAACVLLFLARAKAGTRRRKVMQVFQYSAV